MYVTNSEADNSMLKTKNQDLSLLWCKAVRMIMTLKDPINTFCDYVHYSWCHGNVTVK
jgi:hypothetical protein